MAETNSSYPFASARVKAIENKMQFDPFKFIQEVTVGKMQDVFDSYNKKWKSTKTALGK